MNISQAKDAIVASAKVYFEKDKLGRSVISPEEQLPLFLFGPPGVGKTAIAKQVASELGVGFLSYSMTHHTRQSVLGLPQIIEAEADGKKVFATVYTMSEIIGEVYSEISKGHREGILFLDEINCVSETLYPVMLEFLQQKTFGTHKLPEGWMIVAAGNPAEYNRSARTFDIATSDRIRTIEVDADFETFRTYAIQNEFHPSVVSFLEIKPELFSVIRTTSEGREFATPRGWDNLSTYIKSATRLGLSVDESTVSSYIHCPDVARAFYEYYLLYSEFEADALFESVFSGKLPASTLAKVTGAGFDKRIAIVNVLVARLRRQADPAALENLTSFIVSAWGEGPELGVFVSTILIDPALASFALAAKSTTFNKAVKATGK